MKCYDCGTEVYEDTDYCPNCGATIFHNTQTSNSYGPNSSLFNSTSYDTTSVKKSSSFNPSSLITILVVVIAIGVYFYINYGMYSKYKGDYTLKSCTYMGVTYSIDELETVAGVTMELDLQVKGGRKCFMYINNNGKTDSGNVNIKFKDGKITIYNDNSEKLYGTYNEDTGTISIEANGISLNLEKE